MTLEVKCPQCGKRVPWDDSAPWRPFCSERCRLIDLGQWAAEEHRIAGADVSPEEAQDHNQPQKDATQ